MSERTSRQRRTLACFSGVEATPVYEIRTRSNVRTRSESRKMLARKSLKECISCGDESHRNVTPRKSGKNATPKSTKRMRLERSKRFDVDDNKENTELHNTVSKININEDKDDNESKKEIFKRKLNKKGNESVKKGISFIENKDYKKEDDENIENKYINEENILKDNINEEKTSKGDNNENTSKEINTKNISSLAKDFNVSYNQLSENENVGEIVQESGDIKVANTSKEINTKNMSSLEKDFNLSSNQQTEIEKVGGINREKEENLETDKKNNNCLQNEQISIKINDTSVENFEMPGKNNQDSVTKTNVCLLAPAEDNVLNVTFDTFFDAESKSCSLNSTYTDDKEKCIEELTVTEKVISINAESDQDEDAEGSNDSSLIIIPDSPDSNESKHAPGDISQSVPPITPIMALHTPILVSSTPIMRRQHTTITGSVKRLNSSNKTNKRSSALCRDQTPFKPKVNTLNKSISESTSKLIKQKTAADGDDNSNSSPLPIILVSEQVLLKSIRKRSFSSNDIDSSKLAKNRVKFHSPANVTIPIEDIDKSMKKNISQRRKRSISCVEKENGLDGNKSSGVKGATPAKMKKVSAPMSRTKLPNFTAIHQQTFSKMESIMDHVVKKTERSKNLSEKKLKLDSEKKPSKTVTVTNTQEKEPAQVSGNKPNPRKAMAFKARQRIQLDGIRVDAKQKIPKVVKNVINVSNSSSVLGENVRTLNGSKVDKVVERQKKNMSLFKSRMNTSSGVTQPDNKRSQFIKGVRSNRRFELQMMHRNQKD